MFGSARQNIVSVFHNDAMHVEALVYARYVYAYMFW